MERTTTKKVVALGLQRHKTRIIVKNKREIFGKQPYHGKRFYSRTNDMNYGNILMRAKSTSAGTLLDEAVEPPPSRRPTFRKITKSDRIAKLAKQVMSTCTAKKLCYRQPNNAKQTPSPPPGPKSAAATLTRLEAEDSQFEPLTSQAQIKIQQILGPPFRGPTPSRCLHLHRFPREVNESQ